MVLAGAIIVFGCQKKTNDTADAPVLSPEPEIRNDSDPVSDPVADAPAGNTALAEQVKQLMLMKTVAETDTGIKIVFPLDGAATLNEKSTPQDVSDAMMFATFYTAPLLYGRLAEIDGLHHSFMYKGGTIGDIKMTRASYESLNYAASMQGATDPAAKREVYRKLLKQLPEGAVQIDEKYRP